MQISLKLIQAINHAKSTVCIKYQLLVTFSSLFTGSSSLSVFPQGVLYLLLLWPTTTWSLSISPKMKTVHLLTRNVQIIAQSWINIWYGIS